MSENDPTARQGAMDPTEQNPNDATEPAERPPLLEVQDLRTHYTLRTGWLRREAGTVKAVDGVSFVVDAGEVMALVGESGSGKSTIARTILQLEAKSGGEIRFEGQPVTDLGGDDLRDFRRRVQLITQDPSEAFNPRMTVAEIVSEPLRINGMDDADRRTAIVEDLLERVGLSPDAAQRYPHAFSGGERQRIAIARALSVNPDLIIADEPTSELDTRVRADVLGLLDRIKRDHDVAVLFISHDLDVVEAFADRLAVVYLGEIVERGPAHRVFREPAHPYTRVLLDSVPRLDGSEQPPTRTLTETVPDPAAPPDGCRFHPRCPEIIPPDDLDLGTDDWRAVAELWATLKADEFPEALVGEPTADGGVRTEFDLPAHLLDERAERAVQGAIDAIEQGETVRASRVLDDALPTVCARERPSLVTVDDRRIGCHRYDPAVAADRLPWGG